jgi:DNA-binding transcriptional LysR family regulator
VDRLQAMQIFAAVVERRSLSAAAASLGVSLPTVSRVLRSFERELGVRLISRTTRGMIETEGGKLYYRRCRKILDDMREADEAVQLHAKAPSGELRITAPVTFGRYHVAPSIAQFLERYPRISCFLSLSDLCEPLAEHRFDVAIRVATLRDQALAARRLGYVRRAVVGSKEYFSRQPMPHHPRELSAHNCLHFTHYLRSDEWHFVEGGRPVSVRVHGRFRSDNQEALIDAVLSGAGLAILPTWLVQKWLDTGQLQRVLAEFEPPRTPVHAVFPTQGAPPNKVRSFVEYLAERYREKRVLSSERLSSSESVSVAAR